MSYRENPKTTGSGIVCAIPQAGICPVGCDDCFFQSGRSYLEPLDENLPNMPPVDDRFVVRVNDGNDSNVNREEVIEATGVYSRRFFNTSIPRRLHEFPGPVVLTVNPSEKTNVAAWLEANIPPNLMFVRFRVNTWNLPLCDGVVDHYASQEVPVVLTFMAYFKTAAGMPDACCQDYQFRKRTLNSYWAITHDAWRRVMDRYADNPWVHSCGTEGIRGGSACRHCGNCLREYFATIAREPQSDPAKRTKNAVKH